MKFLQFILYLIFPKDKTVRYLEKLSISELYSLLNKSADSLNQEFFSLFMYRDRNIQTIVHQIKYSANQYFIDICSIYMYEQIIDDLNDLELFQNFTNPILIPVPLAKKKEKERGFNQCELLVKSIEKIDSNNIFEYQYKSVIKTVETKSQTKTKNKKERLKNVRNCFAISDPSKIESRNIILIDDVWTTGQTLSEIKKTLLKAGARQVIAYTIAH